MLIALCCLSLTNFTGCTSKKEIGNTIRVALRDKYKSIDPAHTEDYYSGTLAARAYEGLVQYAYYKRPYEVEPLLAEALPTVSSDQLTYTFKIKKGVYFQTDKAFGEVKKRELVAEDFVYSFKRIADPKEASEGYWIFEGYIKGLAEWRQKLVDTSLTEVARAALWNAPVDGFKALDSHTLQISLVRPYPIFLHVLATNFAYVVAREVVEMYGSDFMNHPVGTGPFQAETITPNQIVWKRNPDYRHLVYPVVAGDPDSGKALPLVDKVVDDIIVEDQPAWLNFMQANHDYMERIPKDNQSAAFGVDGQPKPELAEKGIEVQKEPGVWFDYVAFNMEDKAVGGDQNRWLRQAMALAIDAGPMIEKFYLGLAAIAQSPVPSGIDGYDPTYKNPNREFNLAKARQILSQNGHAEGAGIPELVMDIRNDTTKVQIAEYYRLALQPLGIKLSVNRVTWPEFLKRKKQRLAQMWSASWVYDYPDAQNALQLFYSKNASPGPNDTNFKNSAYDKAYEAYIALADVPANRSKRHGLIKTMQTILESEIPLFTTVHQSETRLKHAWLKNFQLHLFERNSEKYMRVDQTLRAEKIKSFH